MKGSFLTVAKYLLLFCVGLGLLWLTFRKEDLSEVFTKMEQADPFWLAVSVVLGIIAFLSRAVRWIMLMEPLGYKPRLSNTFYALLFGYFANLAIPRIGEITRCGALARVEKVSFNSLIGTVIVERIIDLVMLMISIVLVAFLEYDMLSTIFVTRIKGPLVEKFSILQSPVFITGVIVFILLVVFIIWKYGSRKDHESAWVIKIRNMIKEIASGFQTFLKMKKTGWFIFHTFLIWFLYFLMTWVCFFCLDATRHLDHNAGLFVLVAGGLGMAVPVQGGIGAYHSIVALALQFFGIPLTDGKVYATMVHTTQTLLVVVLGLISMWKLNLFKKKKTADEQV